MFDDELTKYVPVQGMVASYLLAQAEVRQAFEHLAAAKTHLIAIYGKNGFKTDIIDRDHTHLDSCLLQMKRYLWQEIITKSQVRHFLSEKRKKELDEMLYPRNDYEPDKLPEISIEAVQSFISNIAGDLDGLFREAVCEVFDMLRPPRSEYKTNTEYEIGERVVLNYIISHDKWGFTSLNYYGAKQKLINMDNVFHLLDGKPVVTYPDDIVTCMKEAILPPRKWEAETEYFGLRWHKKGTLHVRFKRMDLVAKLNKIAGGNRLKGGSK